MNIRRLINDRLAIEAAPAPAAAAAAETVDPVAHK